MNFTIGKAFVLFSLALALLATGGCDDEVTCSTGQTLCDDACADTARDPQHCGSCGVACDDGEVCVDGSCEVSCPGGLDECDGTCVDADVDPENCGACGTVCDDGEVCSAGDCGATCGGELAECDGLCVNTDSDLANCGDCGAACEAGEVCSAGDCALSCQASLDECDGTCVDTDSDRDYCGDCDTACLDGEICNGAGVCTLSCQDGLDECDATCVNTDVNRDYCGDCDTACLDGEICNGAGVCTLSCQDGLDECDATCVDTDTNRDYCGDCDTACLDGEICNGAGVCTLSCQDGLTECDATCVNTDVNRDYCGDCDTACLDGEICVDGGCVLSCPAGLEECDGTCVDLSRDNLNCGECGFVCGPPWMCHDNGCLTPADVMPTDLRLLALSDWHGQLDSYGVGSPTVQYGGAAALSTYFATERAANPSTITLSAGDAFGASPPLSGFFDEAPTVEAMDLMGFDVSIFGNHGFDQGLVHLQSMIDLADFAFTSSNLANLDTALTGVDLEYSIVTLGAVRVAIIGVENIDTADYVFPGRMGTLTVEDEVAAAMDARAAAEAAGATVFVAVAHVGADAYDAVTGTYSGPLIDLATALEGFHAVIGAHTHMDVDTVVGDTIVMQTASKGGNYARVNLTVVPFNGFVVAADGVLVPAPTAVVTADAAVVDLLDPYRALLAVEYDGVIGVASDIFVRGSNIERLQEVAIGDLTADSMRLRYDGVDFALTNGGGLRAPLPSSYLPVDTALRRTSPGYAAGPPYDLVVGDVYAVLPFGNLVVTCEVTGSQIWDMLENGVSFMPAANGRFAQISGLRFTYSVSAPAGARVTSVTLPDGVTAVPDDGTLFTLATNDFVAGGGDGYPRLTVCTTREVMADVVLDYIVTDMAGAITPTTDGRITQVP